MNVIAWSPNLTQERCDAALPGVKYVSKATLFSTADFISIHMVSTPATKDLVSATEFSQMKPSAFLVNTSRGPLVNEEALLEALNEGKIQGAGLDVYNVEPLPLDAPLRRAKNVTLTPHLGYVSDATYEVRARSVSRVTLPSFRVASAKGRSSSCSGAIRPKTSPHISIASPPS